VRVVIADDELLLREGVARLLADAGIDVVATVETADALLERVARVKPDVALVDIRMPPTHRDEGIVAAREIRATHPETGVLVLSHYLESTYALRLLEDQPERCGYLLKERVSDVAVLVDALRRIAEGECVIDPTIVKQLLQKHRDAGPLDTLTERERDVLAAMAEGHSNEAIAGRLYLAPKTVEANIHRVLQKLDISESPESNRRVLAVLTYLRSA
jgi:DNA-binding NarL/FixJ family response regulator